MPTPPIPQPLRAAAGLAAVAIDSARKLPEQLVGFPVLAVSAALQASLKAQQRYAELVVRGDQLLGQLRGQDAGTPSWARFDEDDDLPGASARPRSAFDLAEDDSEVADLLGGGEDEAAALADAADLADLAGAADLAEAADLADAADVVALADAADLADAAALADAADLAAAADLADAADLAEDLAEAADLAEATTAAGAAELAEQLAEAADLTDAAAGDLAGADAADLLAAAEELVEVDEPVAPAADDGADAAAATDALAADGYLTTEPPIPGYDTLTIPQLRGRLRALSAQQVAALVAYERQARARAPFLTMLENRLTTLRSR